MANKYVTDIEINKIEADIAYYRRSIESVKLFSRGGKDGLKAGLEVLREIQEQWLLLKNKMLANPDSTNLNKAILYRGREEGLETAIGLFSNPEGQINFYKQQMDILEHQLKDYQKLPKR